MRHEAQPIKATMAIVTENGTVFEVGGMMEVEYRTEREDFYYHDALRAGLSTEQAARLTPPPPVLVVTARVHRFEGSLTVPPEVVA